MHAEDLPTHSRFVFWCTAPFLMATIVLLPLLARPTEPSGQFVLGAVVLLCCFVLLGLWDAERFWWCWRAVGGIIASGYLAFLITAIAEGQWFGNGRRSAATVLNALLGLIFFGYPAFMWAVFGRFSWSPEPEYEDYPDEFADFDEIESDADV